MRAFPLEADKVQRASSTVWLIKYSSHWSFVTYLLKIQSGCQRKPITSLVSSFFQGVVILIFTGATHGAEITGTTGGIQIARDTFHHGQRFLRDHNITGSQMYNEFFLTEQLEYLRLSIRNRPIQHSWAKRYGSPQSCFSCLLIKIQAYCICQRFHRG